MDDDKFNMAGVLIYTASGDTYGSLERLIRLGEKGRIEDTIISALKMYYGVHQSCMYLIVRTRYRFM